MALNSSKIRNFMPTDEELLKSFLLNKINNNPLPNHIDILEQDLFGTTKNPWEIWEEFEACHSYCRKDLYFFTTLRNKSATGKRIVRTIGIGAWEGEDVGKPIKDKDTGQTIGIKKRFRFEKSNTPQDGAWIVHEYILDKSLLNNSSDINQVLCRFRKNLKRDRQNTETRIDEQSNSNVMNVNTKISRKKTRTNNIVGQRKTVVPAREENQVLLRQYNTYEPIEPSNNEHNNTNVIDGELQYKEEAQCLRSTVLGIKATIESDNNNAYLKEDIGQNPKYQLDCDQIGGHQTNSNLMNCTELPRRAVITKNVGQDRQRYTIGPGRTATTKSPEHGTAFLRKYTVYEDPREESNKGHNTTNVINTEPLNSEEGLRNIPPQNSTVVALYDINTKYKNNNLESGKNEAEDIMNNDKDGNINMRKEEDCEFNMNNFSLKLLDANKGCYFREDEMLPNEFAKNLLMENFAIR